MLRLDPLHLLPIVPIAASILGILGCSDSSDPPTPSGPAVAKATAVATSGRNVRVSWDVPTGADTVVIERQSLADQSWSEVARRSATRARFLDLGLLPSTTYKYRLRACAQASCGDPYALPDVTTRASVLPPISITQADQGQFSDDIIVMGVASLTESYLSVGHILGCDRTGQILWEYENHGEGIFTEVEALEGRRIAAEQTVQLVEIDLDGSTLKKFTDRFAHHDIDRLPDGRYSTLTFDRIPQGNAKVLLGDGISVLSEDWSAVEWDWLARDHIPFTELCSSCINDDPYNLGRDWTHANALQFDPDGQAFYLSLRNLNRIYRVAYPSGEIEWVMGDGGDFGDGLWSHSHDPHILGGNRVLMLDNGLHRKSGETFSRVIEIEFDPVAKTAGIVWEYRETPDFYSFALGSVHRLESGNTFLADGINGRLAEINPAAKRVWEARLGEGFGTYKAITVPKEFFFDW